MYMYYLDSTHVYTNVHVYMYRPIVSTCIYTQDYYYVYVHFTGMVNIKIYLVVTVVVTTI